MSRRATLAPLLLLAAGCGDLSWFTDAGPQPDPCNAAGGTADVGGTWRFTGAGSRWGCQDPRLDADPFSLGSLALTVSQLDTVLSLLSPQPGFELLGGQVTGTCVAFTTVEQSGDDELRFVWNGSLQSDGSVEGDFTADGPGTCQASGWFRITVD